MPNRSLFLIHNDLAERAILNIEPEGARVPLASGEEVSVIDEFARQPVTVKLGRSKDGDVSISIWPGDGEVRVEKGGVDVLDLVQTPSEMPAR